MYHFYKTYFYQCIQKERVIAANISIYCFNFRFTMQKATQHSCIPPTHLPTDLSSVHIILCRNMETTYPLTYIICTNFYFLQRQRLPTCQPVIFIIIFITKTTDPSITFFILLFHTILNYIYFRCLPTYSPTHLLYITFILL